MYVWIRLEPWDWPHGGMKSDPISYRRWGGMETERESGKKRCPTESPPLLLPQDGPRFSSMCEWVSQTVNLLGKSHRSRMGPWPIAWRHRNEELLYWSSLYLCSILWSLGYSLKCINRPFVLPSTEIWVLHIFFSSGFVAENTYLLYLELLLFGWTQDQGEIPVFCGLNRILPVTRGALLDRHSYMACNKGI